MNGITPAGKELLSAILDEITESGEAICIKRIVDRRMCTLPIQYAYVLLKKYGQRWGLHQERIPSPTGGYLKRITKKHKEKNNGKC